MKKKADWWNQKITIIDLPKKSTRAKVKKKRVSYEKISKMVKDAYANINRKPESCSWYSKGACCPMGAIALNEGLVSVKDRLDRRADKANGELQKIFGQDYVDGFIEGVDDGDYAENKYKKGTAKYIGYQHGSKIAHELGLD